jgi:hypothetical protein
MTTTNHCGAEGGDSVFVCDRENSRIQIFDDEGKYLATIRSVEYGNKNSRPYAAQILAAPNGDPIIVAGVRFSTFFGTVGVLGASNSSTVDPCSSSSLSHGQIGTGASWKLAQLYPLLPKDMREPHMLDVDPRSLFVYVAEMLDGSHSGRLFRFQFKSS